MSIKANALTVRQPGQYRLESNVAEIRHLWEQMDLAMAITVQRCLVNSEMQSVIAAKPPPGFPLAILLSSLHSGPAFPFVEG